MLPSVAWDWSLSTLGRPHLCSQRCSGCPCNRDPDLDLDLAAISLSMATHLVAVVVLQPQLPSKLFHYYFWANFFLNVLFDFLYGLIFMMISVMIFCILPDKRYNKAISFISYHILSYLNHYLNDQPQPKRKQKIIMNS